MFVVFFRMCAYISDFSYDQSIQFQFFSIKNELWCSWFIKARRYSTVADSINDEFFNYIDFYVLHIFIVKIYSGYLNPNKFSKKVVTENMSVCVESYFLVLPSKQLHQFYWKFMKIIWYKGICLFILIQIDPYQINFMGKTFYHYS